MTGRRRPAKPLIMAVDDDPAVLAAVARDLRRHYGEQYRIARADTAAAALEQLDAAKLRGDSVALFLVDQRMPNRSGLEFLADARERYPDARRVLLTAYADTEASIRAINETHLHYYLMKPWDPPEERLYPVLDDLLDDWRAGWQPTFSGVSVIGHAYAPTTHALKDFLTRNLVPYRWLDVEMNPEAERLLAAAGADPTDLPVVVLPDGEALLAPDLVQVAHRIGLKQDPELRSYDLVIVGAGPAGLAAAVYGASEGLSTLLIEAEAPGGQAGLSSAIENYLGFPAGLSGADLARRALTQVRRFGAEVLNPVRAAGIRREDPYRFVKLSDGSEVAARAVLVATGVSYRRRGRGGVRRCFALVRRSLSGGEAVGRRRWKVGRSSSSQPSDRLRWGLADERGASRLRPLVGRQHGRQLEPEGVPQEATRDVAIRCGTAEGNESDFTTLTHLADDGGRTRLQLEGPGDRIQPLGFQLQLSETRKGSLQSGAVTANDFPPREPPVR